MPLDRVAASPDAAGLHDVRALVRLLNAPLDEAVMRPTAAPAPFRVPMGPRPGVQMGSLACGRPAPRPVRRRGADAVAPGPWPCRVPAAALLPRAAETARCSSLLQLLLALPPNRRAGAVPGGADSWAGSAAAARTHWVAPASRPQGATRRQLARARSLRLLPCSRLGPGTLAPAAPFPAPAPCGAPPRRAPCTPVPKSAQHSMLSRPCGPPLIRRRPTPTPTMRRIRRALASRERCPPVPP